MKGPKLEALGLLTESECGMRRLGAGVGTVPEGPCLRQQGLIQMTKTRGEAEIWPKGQ